MYYFTADLHLNHLNKRDTGIIDYCNRPFDNIREMNDILIDNWNSVVSDEDIVIHNGDFCFGNQNLFEKYKSRLNGNKIFIKGNHDRNNVKIQNMFLKEKGDLFFITHNPKDRKKIYFNLTGHVHNRWRFKEYNIKDIEENYYCINIGTDVWGYKPVTLEKILSEFKYWRNLSNENRWKYNGKFKKE